MRRIPMAVLFPIMFTGVLTTAGPGAQSAVPAKESDAKGQAFPARPIRAVVASPASSSPDLIARAVTREAENILGQNFIIDNRAGANGIIAAGIVGNAAPDGYTLLHTAPAFLLNSLVHKNLPYDVRKDFVPVTCVAAGVGYLMLVHPSLPVKTVKEFIALAKQKSLTFSAPPVGGTTTLAAELFNLRAGVQMRHISYRGGSDAVNAVMAGEVDVTFSPPTGSAVHVQSGRLRALGFTGSKRYGRMPDVPLISESGVPDYVVDFTWNAWFAPAKTPAAIVNRLQAAVGFALKTPKIIDFLDAAAFYPVGNTPEEFRVFVDAELKRYAQNLREVKVPVQ
jgi:tripartite-type tricarboxylate transporter receptor subunit TctC